MRALLRTLNARIEFLIGRNHTIGHAYLHGVKSLSQLQDRFLNRIIPLLQEYVFDDWAKLRLIFKDSDKKPGHPIAACWCCSAGTRTKPDRGALQGIVEKFISQASSEAKAKGMESEVIIREFLAEFTEMVN